VTAFLESQKDAPLMATDNGNDIGLYEKGSNIALGSGRGLVGYWPINEGFGTIAHDRSGNGDNGSSAGIQWLVPCRTIGPCVQATTGTVTIGIPYSSNISLSTNFTMIIWAMMNIVQGSSTWPRAFALSNTHIGYGIISNTAGNGWYFEYARDYPTCGGSSYTSGGTFSVSTGTWYQLAVTYDGTSIRGYTNGTLSSTVGVGTTTAMCAATSTNLFNIGQHPSSTDYFTVSDARLYNRVLTATEEIQGLYNAAK
jgi:hypothetical protein